MNSLDKAFLTAYSKQTEASAYPPNTPVPGLPPGAYLQGAECDSPPAATPSYADDVQHRFDPPHGSAESSRVRPHASFPISTESGADAADQPSSPPQPAPVQMPSVLRAPDDFDETEGFSPDWEVDRFHWPGICERLLEAESRYFRHVGDRLKAATTEAHHVVMVSGCRRGEGRTTLALCLARSAAAAGVHVAVVDADWQNPQIGPRLGMETPCGWTEVLAGKAALNEAAVASIEDQLTLFPLKPPVESRIDAADSGLCGILRMISAHFPLVIIDAGPLGSEDCPPFTGEEDGPIDTAIVVRDLRFTTEKKTLATAQRLQQRGIAAIGIAENFESR